MKTIFITGASAGLGKATAVTMSANQKDASVNFKVDVK
ncbi:MAG: short-chain dehydrogenase, partial [Sphingobacteriales bacterium]